MATTLVTGGTGFIGSHVVKQLAERGDALRLLIRKGRDASHLDWIEFERADGDITDRDSVRAAMDGVERVFHVAGKTSMRTSDRERVFEVNVGGTRNVMEEALRAGVIRAVHTSSAGAVGPAEPEGTADESQPFTAGRLGSVLAESPATVLNIGRLSFIDVAGCRVLATWAQGLDRPVEVTGASRLLQRMWRLLALDQLAPVDFTAARA